MKQILIIAVVSIFLVLGLSFIIFNSSNFNFTGYAIYDGTNTAVTNNTDSIVNNTSITKEMALRAINESEAIIQEMQKNNFSIVYMNDSLIEAKRVFEQARYADILRGNINSTEKEKQEARQALSLIKWQNITYRDVIKITDVIKARKEEAFLISDKIYVLNNRVENNPNIFANSPNKNLTASLNSLKSGDNNLTDVNNNSFIDLFARAQIAFREDRYAEAEDFLQKARESYDSSVAESSILIDLRRGLIGFIQQYWFYILTIIIIISVAGYYTYKKFEKDIIKNKIKKMKTEEQVLNDLMKKTQEERFKENKISGLVYNIRMKKYQERLQEIKEELPVLEERLNKLIMKRKK
jgi:hypothetical protein